MKKEEREKRNESIRMTYEAEMFSPYIKGKSQAGSSWCIEKLAKKHKLTVSAIYQILK